jgi:hypothetical protein
LEPSHGHARDETIGHHGQMNGNHWDVIATYREGKNFGQSMLSCTAATWQRPVGRAANNLSLVRRRLDCLQAEAGRTIRTIQISKTAPMKPEIR